MKNNQIVFSATIHVILIHQTNFLSSCLTIHNSSTHPNRNSTPVVLCPVASYCCPSVPHCQRKLFCCQLPVTMWGAPAEHCGPFSFALCISSSDLVNRQSSWPPAPAQTICLSVSLSLSHSFYSCIQHYQQKIPANGCCCKLGAPIQYVHPVLGTLSISSCQSLPFFFYSIPFLSELSSLCAY